MCSVNNIWRVASLTLLGGFVLLVQPVTQRANSPSPIVSLTKQESVMPAQRSLTPAALHHYPINTNPFPAFVQVIPIVWPINTITAKTIYDVQESHDLKTWKTIYTNIHEDPWVWSPVKPTYWRVVAR